MGKGFGSMGVDVEEWVKDGEETRLGG